MRINYVKPKINYIVLLIMIWMIASSPCIVMEKVPDPEPTPENINRLELEGWKPNVSIYADDGSINRIILLSKAEYVAKVLYGTARYHSKEQQKTVIWCIINRMESKWYPNSIEEVCSQPYQFKGYSISNPVEDRLLQVSADVLWNYYETHVKPCSNDFVYMSATNSDIVLRDSFEETKTTRHWRFYDEP